MQVRDVMHTPTVTIGPDATLHDAIGVMLTHRIGSVVVADAGPVGILTRSDVLRAAYHRGCSLPQLSVTAGMSSDLVTTEPSTSTDSALRTMETHDIKKLPVVEELELVGIVTMTDIARHQPERAREIREGMQRRDDWTD